MGISATALLDMHATRRPRGLSGGPAAVASPPVAAAAELYNQTPRSLAALGRINRRTRRALLAGTSTPGPDRQEQ